VKDLAQDQGRPLAGGQLAEHGGLGEPPAVLGGGKLGQARSIISWTASSASDAPTIRWQ
jgi:hypothetical protein